MLCLSNARLLTQKITEAAGKAAIIIRAAFPAASVIEWETIWKNSPEIARRLVDEKGNNIPFDDNLGQTSSGTRILEQAQSHSLSIGKIARTLGKLFSANCRFNIYDSPTNGNSFGPHKDSTPILVFQMIGSKHWAFEVAPLILPEKINPDTNADLSPPMKSEPLLLISMDPPKVAVL